jgi:site-specific DNA recombinase
MSSTNGHGPKRAILYARVSTDEQAKSGYSLAQQMEALREYAAREGYEVLEEVIDPGQSGASLERPGMDRIRDLVAAGGVSVVLAQDRDRFAREPAYHYLLRREFEERGCKLKALNDRGDESPEGELTDGILDQLAKFERAKTAERTRRGKLRKVQEGKLLAGSVPNFGFKFNPTRDGYEVDEEAMRIVRRIFYLIGVEGRTLYGVGKVLRGKDVPTPNGKKLWSQTSVRKIINNDVYRPHERHEIEGLIAPEIVAKLDPHEKHGLWWFNKYRITSKHTVENTSDGRHYRKKTKTMRKPESEWIAVPVPDSGVPREWVDAARAAIRNNRKASSNGDRFWELSGGITWCGLCGARMCTNVVKGGSGRKHFYYRCWKRMKFGEDACPLPASYQAHRVESAVWEFVSSLLKNPEQLRADLDRMIELERQGLRGDPDREAKVWLEKVSEVDRKRSGFQDMAAEGLITLDELKVKLAGLEELRETARWELDALSRRREKIEELERDKDALLETYVGMVPEALDSLTPKEHHFVYKMLRLRVALRPDAPAEVSGVFGGDLDVSKTETASGPRSPLPTRRRAQSARL